MSSLAPHAFLGMLYIFHFIMRKHFAMTIFCGQDKITILYGGETRNISRYFAEVSCYVSATISATIKCHHIQRINLQGRKLELDTWIWLAYDAEIMHSNDKFSHSPSRNPYLIYPIQGYGVCHSFTSVSRQNKRGIPNIGENLSEVLLSDPLTDQRLALSWIFIRLEFSILNIDVMRMFTVFESRFIHRRVTMKHVYEIGSLNLFTFAHNSYVYDV